MPGMIPSIPRLSAPTVRASASTGRSLRSAILVGMGIGIVAALGVEFIRVCFGANTHEILPGRIYRSAQLSPSKLSSFIESRGIRTVVNLRGYCAQFPWYENECALTQDLGISQEDITLSANRFPPPGELRRLVEVLDRCEYPILLHCRQGADRTGLASAIALLLYSDADYATARRQCSPRYGHLPIMSTRRMDDVFEMYETWLSERGETHSPARFRYWLLEEYTPGPGSAEIQAPSSPIRVTVAESASIPVRVINRSKQVWEFKPGTHAGVFMDASVLDITGNRIHRVFAGQFHAKVGPGEAIDLTVAIPRIHQPGSYYVHLDMAYRHMDFVQLGSEVVMVELQVTPH